VTRLYPSHRIAPVQDGTLLDHPNPPHGHVYAGCFPGLTIMCTNDAALDRPSQPPQRFLDEAAGTTVYLHAMHSVVDWFAYAIWDSNGTLQRSLSLSPGFGIIENAGAPLDFEAPYWAGAHPVSTEGFSQAPYPLPFHPLELAENALRPVRIQLRRPPPARRSRSREHHPSLASPCTPECGYPAHGYGPCRSTASAEDSLAGHMCWTYRK
jgi:hypothetical protein